MRHGNARIFGTDLCYCDFTRVPSWQNANATQQAGLVGTPKRTQCAGNLRRTSVHRVLSRSTGIPLPPRSALELKFRIIVKANAGGETNVRFGSKADICAAKSEVCFTPGSDHESGHAPMVMSALPLEADMCSARDDVCFGPIADIWFPSAPENASAYSPVTDGGCQSAYAIYF